MFLPVLPKLQSLLNLLEQQQTRLCHRTSVDDQASLLRQEPVCQHPGIQNPGILSQVEFCYKLDTSAKDRLELIERKTLQQLVLFTRKCVDVIEFLRIVSFDGNQQHFQKMLYNLSKEEAAKKRALRDSRVLQEMAATCFRDMVLEGGCEDNGLDFSVSSVKDEASPKAAFMI